MNLSNPPRWLIRWKWQWYSWSSLILCSVLCYVLSAAPVMYLAGRYQIPDDAYVTLLQVYYPIILVGQNTLFFDPFFSWEISWVELFIGPDPRGLIGPNPRG